MEFIFDLLAEIILEPIIVGYLLLMSRFNGKPKKIDEDKAKTIVVFEGLVLLVLFVVGGVMLLETDGASFIGKILLIASIAVSVIQISLGIIINGLKNKDDFKRKITTEEQLKDLIKRMCNEDDCGEESISWQAYREAEKLSDKSFLPFLCNTIIENQKNTKRDKTIRKSVYSVIGYILKNSFDENGCTFLIERLNVETDKYIISDILGSLVWIDIPLNIDIDPIIHHSKSDNWLIRHSAIQALGSSATAKSKEMINFYLNQTNKEKYEREIVYASFDLGKIGKSADIQILEQHLSSKIEDIRDSALYAIDSIKERNDIM